MSSTTSTEVNQSDLIKYRTNLIQALEELQYKRTECSDLRNRVEKLLANKLQAEQSLDEAETKIKNAELKHEELKNDLKQASILTNEAKFKEENQKLKESLEAADKTVIGLKKELSLMSLARHHLEINLKQAEQKVSSRETSTSAVLERLKSIETTTEKLSKLLQESTAAQTLLQKNVEASKALNKELVRACAHGTCLVNEYKKERDELQKQLLDQETRYRLKEDNGGTSDKEKLLTSQITELKNELKCIEDQNSSFKQVIQDLRCRLLDAENSVSDAHKIVEKSNGDHKDVVELQQQVESSGKIQGELKQANEELENEIAHLKTEHENQIAKLKEQSKISENEMIEKIENLNKKLASVEESVKKSKTELEKHVETQRNMQELKVRFDSVEHDKRIYFEESTKLREENKILKEKVDQLNKNIEENETKNRVDFNNQESQTDAEIASINTRIISADTVQPSHTPILHDLCYEKKRLSQSIQDREKPSNKTTGESSQGGIFQEIKHSSKEANADSSDTKINSQPNELTIGGINSEDTGRVASPNTCNPNPKCAERSLSESIPVTISEPVVILPSNKEPSKEKQVTQGMTDNIVSTETGNNAKWVPGGGNVPIVEAKDSCSDMKKLLSCKDDMVDSAGRSSPSGSASDLPATSKGYETSLSFKPEQRNREQVEALSTNDSIKSSFQSGNSMSRILSDNNGRRSPVLLYNKNSSFTTSDQNSSAFRPRISTKKRKLSSTPPMLSQCSQFDTDPVCKQAPLRSVKNFTKQVLSNKPQPKQPNIRYKPLDMVSNTSASYLDYNDENDFREENLVSSCNTPVTQALRNGPYTSYSFAKDYVSLQERKARRFVSHSNSGNIHSLSPTSTDRIVSGTSGGVTMGFRSRNDPQESGFIPASDEDDPMIEVCESDESL